MNWNFFEKWRERREQKRKLKDLQRLTNGLRTLDQLEQSGLLAWDAKQRRLYIDSSLAVVMMRSAEAWQAFIQNVYLWTYNREAWRTTEEQITKLELKAVRDYGKQHPELTLTRADIDRIRQARRLELAQEDINPAKVDGFEFFVVSPPNLSEAKELSTLNSQLSTSSDPVGDLIAVGHYDPQKEQMEMATWEEVQRLLNTNEQ